MYLAYSLLLSLGLLVLIPRFLFQAIAHGKYRAGFRERLGFLPFTSDKSKPVIWLHCVSVGETQAARPLVVQIRTAFPEYSLVVSTITLTGQRLAREVFRNETDRIFYFPFDFSWSTRRALTSVQPKAVLVMETELWPNFLRECKKREVPVALVNGRISRQSFRRYKLVRFLMRRVFSGVCIAAMQSEKDAARISALGMPHEKIVVAGNLKFDSHTVPPSSDTIAEIRARFNFDHNVPMILAASTHAPEERIILESFRELEYRQKARVRLVFAPRHPERFQEVAALLRSSGFSWARRTDPPGPSDAGADLILLDTIGELPAVYPSSTIVFVGGSLVDKGGHNLLEPAASGKAVITGAYTHNFEAITNLLIESDAIVQIQRLDEKGAAEALRDAFDDLLNDDSRRKALGERAKQMVAENQGAAQRTLKLITPLLASQQLNANKSKAAIPSNATSE